MFQKINQIRASVSDWIKDRIAGQECAAEERADECGEQSSRANSSQENSTRINDGIMSGLITKLRRLRNATGERANQLAESLARQLSSWTGKDVTAEDVKKGATNGAIVGTIVAMFLVANRQTSSAWSLNDLHSTHGAHSGHAAASCNGTSVPSHQQTEEEFLEQCRIEDDHLDYVRQEEQQQYYDQMQDVIDDQVSYNEF